MGRWRSWSCCRWSTLGYQWQSRLGDGSGWQPLGTVTATATFDGSLLAINSTTSIRRLTLATLNGVSCSSPSNVVTVTTSIDRAPVISVSPSTAVCVSDITTMLFSVSTTGSDTGGGTPDSGGGVDAYQWKKNGVDITGETSWQYIPSVGDFDNGDYNYSYVSMTGDYPCTYTSSGITSKFNSPPTAVTYFR